MMELKKRNIYFTLLKVLVIVLLLAGIIVAAVISFTNAKTEQNTGGGGAVVTNGLECAKMGASILKKGGSVADAAVTTIICEGITCPQSTGVSWNYYHNVWDYNNSLFYIRTRRRISFDNLH